MSRVFLTMHDKVVWVPTVDLAELTLHLVLVAFLISLVALFLLLSPLEVQLILQLNRFLILRLPEPVVPRLSHSIWEHQIQLGRISEVVTVVFDYAHNVAFSTRAEFEIKHLLPFRS